MTATTLSAARDPGTGRFRARTPLACCAGCGWTLAEDLCGRLYCPHQTCDAYRVAVDVAPGVDSGTLTPADLEPER